MVCLVVTGPWPFVNDLSFGLARGRDVNSIPRNNKLVHCRIAFVSEKRI